MPSVYVPLRGSYKRPPAARWLSPAAPGQRFSVTVVLYHDQANLEEFVGALGEQPAAARTYLSRSELAERFGAAPEDVEAVREFARQHGLRVLAEHPERATVELGGTVAAFSRAFRVRLHNYQSPAGVFRGRVWVIRIPAELAQRVRAVLGLDNRPVARPHFRFAPVGRAAPAGRGARPAQAAAAGFSPTDFNALYSFPAGTDGTGQCIGIIELGGGYTDAELQRYFTGLGITPPTVTAVNVDGGRNAPTGDPNSADTEVLLDIEVAGALAPKANFAVYFAPNTDKGFIDAVYAAVHDTTNNPNVISISWGGPEPRWTLQSLRAMNAAFWAAQAVGITVLVAAGDSGSGDGINNGRAYVDFPASSPLVVGCGGTRVQASGGQIATEVVWNDPGNGATGGGVSARFAVPAYQASINPITVNPGHWRARGVPDVAGDASPSTGYKILADGQPIVVGGTSAVAPLWSALLARVQQKVGHSVAPLQPAIYAAGGAFRDITTGNNGAYRARPGWDACTGLGSPNGAALVAMLASGNSDGAAAAERPVAKSAPRRAAAAKPR
jgi:kumamolisin